ncbi:DUF1697 domain-containing protein [Psychrosphaera sp. B3R10]|uniref:DUF1697 domain-containing protein n=1 Tax=unclassified Psychrosphaera TaxID=2641570 RepID=UPI001C08438C|nr:MULTISPECIES: DUF1697 domain-containing protein [unclassified Psychrosphaera]MBU2881782.1 DUF1697 domain-containing protein [Psychrosphaera sp. I2R16]MBU2991212.1 DUF1697 domain-containing protein [Psychrosphaera sp. B3R10]
MQQFVVLLKGVNVGGKNLLPMKDFVALLMLSKFENVSSYIQSGNIVLKSTIPPADAVQATIAEHYGFSPEVFSLNEAEFTSAVDGNPYAEFEGKFVHFYFCKNDINLVTDKLTKYLADSEKYTVKGNVFYLHAPNGIGRSKLIANIESCLGQTATGRNLNTINKLGIMLNNLAN